jgi:hypothetical protein
LSTLVLLLLCRQGADMCVILSLPGHRFHKHCILEWLSTSDTSELDMLCPFDKGPWEWML